MKILVSFGRAGRALQFFVKTIVNETELPTEMNLPPLEYHQTKRIEHRLSFRRH